MDYANIVLVVANMLMVGFLPVIFFRSDGKLTVMWFFTALPYAVAPVLLILQSYGYFQQTLVLEGMTALVVQTLSLLLVLVSFSLIFLTLGTHRIPLALWHQNPKNDEPQEIVTWGAYKKIRHPFYTSFIIANIAFCLTSLHWSSLVVLAYVYLFLNHTAAKEEKRLAGEASNMGKQYKQYMTVTGRFFPTL